MEIIIIFHLIIHVLIIVIYKINNFLKVSPLTESEKLKGCTQIQHNGHCILNTARTKYYFDPTTATCHRFEYNGCGGTYNRYDSLQECYLYCFSKLKFI